MNNYHLFWIIPLILIIEIVIGMSLVGWCLTNKIRKELVFKSMKEFIEHVKKAQKLQKKMEKTQNNPWAIMKDPEIRKQMEEFQKKFGKKQ